MSENETDPRITRTRDRLGDALIALMQQKPFDDITVQEVLDRAGIGRSTFYAHYRDKNDLLMSDVEDFFGMMAALLNRRQAALDRVAPVRELFAHVLAGSLFALLEWWIDRGSHVPPETMDAMFHRMVWTGIGRT